MAELTSQERLQPSLLDRLTDDESKNPKESRERRVMSVRRLKDSVLRDLRWLLNTTSLIEPEELKTYPHAAASVLNYGIPDLAGLTSTSVDPNGLARLVREAVINFEPRILRNTVKVELRLADDAMDHNTLAMHIEGELWALPTPVHMFLKTSLDLESGTVQLSDQSARG